MRQVLFCWMLTCVGFGSLDLRGQDTLNIFSPEDLYNLVAEHHPVARQAGLLSESARARILQAKGAFDPKLYGFADQKTYKGALYYRYIETGLKTATTLAGIQVKAGYESATGQFINNENTLPNAGLYFAGVSVPLGRDLFIDERRNALQQARIFTQLAEAQQAAILNDLFFDTAKTYWEWAMAYGKWQLQEEAVEVADIRRQGLLQSYRFGDRPGIDTLEAFLNWQNRLIARNQSLQEYQVATFNLSNFLWLDGEVPLEITAELVPFRLEMMQPETAPLSDSIATLAGLAMLRHPDLQMLSYSLNQLEVERRFKADRLKPGIYLDYNLINEPFGFLGDGQASLYPQIWQNNYKFGLSVDFPLFLRKERGSLALTRLKIQETTFKQDLKMREISNKIRGYGVEVGTQAEQIRLYTGAAQSYQTLLEAEETKFRAGESSLFLINSRENSLIDARTKLLETAAKYAKAKAGIIWASGMGMAEE